MHIPQAEEAFDIDALLNAESDEEGTTLEWEETPQDGGGPLTRSISCD